MIHAIYIVIVLITFFILFFPVFGAGKVPATPTARIKSCTVHGKTFNAMKSMPKWEKRLKRQKSRPDEAALVGVA